MVGFEQGEVNQGMHYTDEQIIDCIKRRDSKAIEYFYNETMPSMLKMVVKSGGTEAEAADVMQDAMLALFRNIKLNKYKDGGAKLSTYVIQMGRYIWYAKRRKLHRKVNVPLQDFHENEPQEVTEVQLEKIEFQKQIHLLINRLGSQCQKILKLFYWEEKNLTEIAKSLDMEVSSVKNGKYRCMKQLRNIASSLNL